MFGKKKDFGQQLTEQYQAAHAQSDLGKRLLALDRLEEKLDKLTDGPPRIESINSKEFFGGMGIGAAAGAAAGAATMDPFAFLMLGLVGVIPGMIGGMIYTTSMVPWRRKISNNQHHIKQLKKVVPFKPVIDTLSSQIAQDKNTIMSVTHAEELQKSSKLEEVVKKHPRLLDVFKKAQETKPKQEIPRVAVNNNSQPDTQSQKTDKGFSL